MKKPGYANTFCIQFDTEEMPGTIVAVQVTIQKIVMRRKDTARIDRRDHPLYPHLKKYVEANQ